MSNTIKSVSLVSPFRTVDAGACFTIDTPKTPFLLQGVCKVAGEYVFSGWIKADTTATIEMGTVKAEIETDWTRVVIPLLKSSSDTEDVAIYFNTATTYYMYHAQLEMGNKATKWQPAPEDVQSGIDAAQETADTTKTYFYNDSSGSHVRNQDSTSAGTRADVKTDGLHITDQDDGKELASFTSSGATIGKDSETHSRYLSDGVHFYEGGKSYPFSQIKPITYENEKYSAAVFATAPDDISTDDGLYHSGATVDVTAINGTARDNTGVGRVTLTATTVKSADSKEAYIDVFASNNNPNKASGVATGTDTYINMNAEEVYVNGSAISEIGKIYTTTINYTTKTWAQGTRDKTLTLPAGTYIVLSGVNFTDTKTGTYRQYQMQIASGSGTIYPEWLGLYQPANNNSADAYSTVLHVVVATSSCSIRPYIHTPLANWTIPVNIVAVRIR